MARNLFRTAAIGMVAVAGLLMLFFIVRIVLIFLVAGFIVRMAGRYFGAKRAQQYRNGAFPSPFSREETPFDNPFQAQQPWNNSPQQRPAVVEIKIN